MVVTNIRKTGNIPYQRGIYVKSSANSDQSIIDYSLFNKSVLKHDTSLTEIVRLELDNGFHETSRKFEYYFYLRNDTNWQRCSKSGLAFTQKLNVFEGNISRPVVLQSKNNKGKDFETPQHFIITQFVDDKQLIVVDIFNDFYPRSKTLLNAIVKEHKLYK